MRKITDFFNAGFHKDWFCFAVVALFCLLPVAIPMVLYGIPYTPDVDTNLRFAVAFSDASANLHFFPDWANDNLGFGSIGIRFYPPIALYVLSFVEMLTRNWFDAIWISLTIWMVVGCAGVYIFVREWGTPAQAMMAAIIYAVVPQHLTDVYQWFLYSEFAAWGVIPFCFLFVTRICRRQQWIDVFLFAIAFSTLILLHLPTTMIASLSLPVFVLTVFDRRHLRKTVLQLVVSIGLALAASAFYLVNVVSEVQWLTHNDPEYTAGYFAYTQWLFPNILIPHKLFIQVMTARLFDITIVLTAMLLVPAVIYLIKHFRSPNGPAKKVILALAATGFFSLFMLSRLSSFVWYYLTILQKIQFPWRWLSIVSLMSVLSFALSLPLLITRYKDQARIFAYAALSVIVVMSLMDLTQIVLPSEPVSRLKISAVVAEFPSKPIWLGWWPVWAKDAAFENRAKVTARNRSVDISKWEPEEREFTVQPGEGQDLRIATFYYPYWKAKVNDQVTEVGKDDNGAITLPVTGESSRVRLYFEEPPVYRVAGWLSLLTWAFLILVIGYHVRRSSQFVLIKQMP